jgi:hypothetical protein
LAARPRSGVGRLRDVWPHWMATGFLAGSATTAGAGGLSSADVAASIFCLKSA